MTVTFRRKDDNGNILDSGVTASVESISPVTDGENISQLVLRRPSDNLRTRTDELARAVSSLEYLVQSAVNSTTLLRYVSVDNTAEPGVVKLYSKDFSGEKVYYITPELPSGASTGSNPSIVVIGSSTKTYNYVISKSALESFYSIGDTITTDVDNHSKYFGLSKVGDTLCLRVPLVSASYSSENLLPRTTSLADPAGQAELADTLVASLTDTNVSLSDTRARNSILKLSSRNSVVLTVSSGALYDFLVAQVALVNEDKSLGSDTFSSLEIRDSNTAYTYMPLDLNGLVRVSDTEFRVPRAGYWDFEGLADSTSSFDLRINTDSNSIQLDNSFVSFPTDTMLPPNEYLHPLAVHTGDSILVTGLGGVRIFDIEARDNSEAFMDTAGRILGETGTAVSIYKTRTRISYESLSTASSSGGLRDLLIQKDDSVVGSRDYFRLPIDVYIPEAGLGQELYLSDLRIHMVLDEEYANSVGDNINTQEVRDVYISLGAYNLRDNTLLTDLTSDSGVRFSLEKTVLSLSNGSSVTSTSALPGMILADFSLKNNMQDDNIAVVELTDSIASTSLLNKTILLWVYRDDALDFFDVTDRGSFRFDLHFTWSTRLGDNINLASSSSLALLSPN